MDTIRNNSDKILIFMDLNVGDIFEDVDDGCLYIKIKPRFLKVEEKIKEPINALCFTDGNLYFVDSQTEVKKFNGALVEGYIHKDD